ncbi:MAG TPA: bifunctional ornithine acetyltransferase/N-acetylglutamate synthase, partial [Solirubrobacteraceae bacterium]|nr:bifunctional ornithine acetyltransferase/N-acetylglutamate synthase [Solirubrobacteraceae bacterium]
PLDIDISMQGTQVCSAGAAVDYNHAALADALADKEIEYEIALPGEGTEIEVFFSDLSHEYVTINADYTT